MNLAKQSLKSLKMWIDCRLRYRPLFFGKRTYVGVRVHIRPNSLWIGADSFVGSECWLAVDDLQIGNFVMLAARVSVVGGDHRFDIPGSPCIHSGRDVSQPVRIEDDVWIGHGATILHGTSIGEGAIIGAGAMVTKDVEPYTIVAGFPARKLRDRFAPEDRSLHQSALNSLRKKLGYRRIPACSDES